MSVEQWKPVPGYVDRLMVSDFGRVRYRRVYGDWSTPVQPSPDERGYCSIRPRGENGSRLCVMVHNAVWTAFNGSIPEGHTIDHGDRNRSNNRLNNLKPATGPEQRANTATHKRRRDARPISVWKLSDPTSVWTFDHSRAAAEELGADQRALRSVANGKCRRTGAFGARWATEAEFYDGEEFRCVLVAGCIVSVSNFGRLLDGKSRAFAVTPTATRGNGYPTCGSRSVLMHAAVAAAWPELIGGSPSPGKTLDHIDRNRNNNHPSNLRWATVKEQAANRSTSD